MKRKKEEKRFQTQSHTAGTPKKKNFNDPRVEQGGEGGRADKYSGWQWGGPGLAATRRWRGE